MKKKKLVLLFGVFIFLFTLVNLYDLLRSPYNGIVYGLRYNRILIVTLLLIAIIIGLTKAIRSRFQFIRTLSFISINIAIMIVLIEIVSVIALKTKWISGDFPRHHLFNSAADLALEKKPFWGDMNVHFAKWRQPNDSLVLNTCDDRKIVFKTNSHGARDKERTFKSLTGKRALFLGDSFIEGFMVDSKDRSSDLLEEKTGVEHLNFGINGTSPINYFLTYKHLAKKFEHDMVIIGVLPANDFEDFTEETKPDLIRVPIYRPYWKLNEKPFRIAYSLDSLNMSANSLHHFYNPNQIYKTINSVFSTLNLNEKIIAILADNSYSYQLLKAIFTQYSINSNDSYSRFTTYSKKEWTILSYSLEMLFKEAKGKQIVVLLYPILKEVKTYDKYRQNVITRDIQALCKRYNVTCVDFLSKIHEYPKDHWQDLYIACDGHWSPLGEKFASEVIYNQPSYQRFLQKSKK